ncbi:phospholipase effector Tle1 domain-containing protein [Undibacterium sp. Ji83W]|uniref:phospholipase effector Tle1 domain-containing protein n=1 Tax=Undibacterium sp. Ji83W TaxID=3413043 RepID=UPI003BEFA6BE
MTDPVKSDPVKSDGVDVTQATPAQLATYTKAETEINAFKVPQLYDSKDPNSRVFVALFDGTGNDAIHDPKHITNVGLLKDQVEAAAQTNPNIGGYYKEGPGTQGGLKGALDGATGGTYQERLEDMYEQFDRQAAVWLKENPDAKISVVSVGFSRGAEQAAGFTRLVDERGIQDPNARKVDTYPLGLKDDKITYTAPPLREPGEVAQALAMYDPVATGAPERKDRRPADSVLSGLQIKAGDEHRSLFPADNIIPQGLSADKRFLGVTTAGCHSDVGGGYELNGLSTRNFNLMTGYLNATLGSAMILKREVPVEPEKSVIHDSTQHQFFYRRVEERGMTAKQDPQGRPVEPVDKKVAEPFNDSIKPITATRPGADLNVLSADDSPSNRLLSRTPEVAKPVQPKL